MSSTNKTTNYQLSQFVSTDKPAWLTDYNQDMSKIDTGIKSAADTASGADGKADANSTKIGNLDYLSTTTKTDIVAAINEVDTNTDTAQATANSASTTANNAQTVANQASGKVNALASYMSMTNTAQVADNNITISAGSINSKNVNYASNADGTLGKLYGWLFGINIPGATTITITNLPFNVTEDFEVLGVAFAQATSDKTMYYPAVQFKTNNTATISFSAAYAGLTLNVYFAACLIFMQNFGDQE